MLVQLLVVFPNSFSIFWGGLWWNVFRGRVMHVPFRDMAPVEAGKPLWSLLGQNSRIVRSN